MNKQQNIKKITLEEYQQLNHNNDDLEPAKKSIVTHNYDIGSSSIIFYYFQLL